MNYPTKFLAKNKISRETKQFIVRKTFVISISQRELTMIHHANFLHRMKDIKWIEASEKNHVSVVCGVLSHVDNSLSFWLIYVLTFIHVNKPVPDIIIVSNSKTTRNFCMCRWVHVYRVLMKILTNIISCNEFIYYSRPDACYMLEFVSETQINSLLRLIKPSEI